LVVLLAAARPCSAQDYPTRPVRIVFPLAAGGGGDVFTRALADELQKHGISRWWSRTGPAAARTRRARLRRATPDG